MCRSKPASSVSSRIRPSATSRLRIERDGRRERCVERVLRLLVPAPVEVEAAATASTRSSTCAGTEAIASPGGHISAFCEPETTTSIPQASVSSGTAPSDEIASTTSRASPTASLTARTSETTPVDVSDCWQNTSSTPDSRTAAPTSSASGTSPQS